MEQVDVSDTTSDTILVKKRNMWWLLIPLGVILFAAIALWLVLKIGGIGSMKTLSSASVKSYNWDKVEVDISSQLTLGLNSAGKSEYLLSLNSVEAIPNCTGKTVDPQFTKTATGDRVTITLQPTLTGGTCKSSGFNGDHPPDDSRRLFTSLDIGTSPLTVVIKEGDKESQFQLSATNTKIKVTPLSVDPQQLVFTATDIDKNPDWIFAVFSPKEFTPVFPDPVYKSGDKVLDEASQPRLILPHVFTRFSTSVVGRMLQHGTAKDMGYYQLGWLPSGTDDVKEAYKELQGLVPPALSDQITVVRYSLDGTSAQWPATPEYKLTDGAAAFPSLREDDPADTLEYMNYNLGVSFSYPGTLTLDVQPDATTLTSSDIADKLTISEDKKVNSVEEATARITDILAQPPFVQAEERTVDYDKKAYVWESSLGGRSAMEVIMPSRNPDKSIIFYFENYDGNADVVWNLRNQIIDKVSLWK